MIIGSSILDKYHPNTFVIYWAENSNDIISDVTTIISLDIETTGLDPSTESIIDIGALRFNSENNRIENEFNELINPNRPIPYFITQLTGITNDMVRGRPDIDHVRQKLKDFVADDIVLGHNINFDLSFLRQQGLLEENQSVDTYELASVLLPSASRYNLTSLCQITGAYTSLEKHRALEDARNTYAIFCYLKDKALCLPIELIAEFVRLSESIEWGAKWLFKDILRNRWVQQVKQTKTASRSSLSFGISNPVLFPPLKPNEKTSSIDVDSVTALLEHGGAFSKSFDNYEYRPQQVAMLKAVSEAFSDNQHLMVEAGTGTGKSFAYLIPSAIWAMENNRRVLISTNTINLQDQLISKDIPDLRAVLEKDLRSVIMKGRANYLCPRRLEGLRHRSPANADEMRVLAKVLVWLYEGGSGDRGEINLNGPIERDIWARLSAENEGCAGEVCLARMGGLCPFYRMRQAAQSAHLLVVNHALLLSDVSTGSRVLPDYDYLIVDEAHHMEMATTNALSYGVTEAEMVRVIRELGGKGSGVLGYLMNQLKPLLNPSEYSSLEKQSSSLTNHLFHLEHELKEFFNEIGTFLGEIREGQPIGNYSQQVRITHATRTQPAWAGVEIAWDTTEDAMSLLVNSLSKLHQSLNGLGGELTAELEDTISSVGNILQKMSEAYSQLTSWVGRPDSKNIYWAEIHPTNMRIMLHIAPLHIGDMMEEFLWHEKSSIILTSATLTTNNEFDYLRDRLNADEADELVVGSPFDYENSAMLYLVNDIPEPVNHSSYQRAVEQTLLNLAKATRGRMLGLFTSYSQLKQTSQSIGRLLADANIQVYEQGEGASANTLLETFRASDQAVLFGTRSFWEGVDIPGEKLSVLVIVRLPFDVPSDPIVAARSETFDDPFNEYSLPEAILRFRQGFGRLIRTESDRGIVAVLDRRILTKRYGRFFIDSLPTCNIKVGSMHDLPQTAVKWLNL